MNRLIAAIGVSSLLIASLSNGALAKNKLYGYATNAPKQNPQLVKAVQAYAEHKYKESATSLEYIDAHGGCCDKVHYFLGLDYQNLNQTVLAQLHYQWVSSRSKDARLRQYADSANETLAYYQAHRSYSGQGGISPSMSFG